MTWKNENLVHSKKVVAVLMKADGDWLDKIKKLYLQGVIAYANHFHIDPARKPVNLQDGSPVYIYVEKPYNKTHVTVLATGIFRKKILPLESPFSLLDSQRIMTVKEAFDMYGACNGEKNYPDFKYLVQNVACRHSPNGPYIKIEDDYMLGATIIDSLTFTRQKYRLHNHPTNACGFRYIELVQGTDMYLSNK